MIFGIIGHGRFGQLWANALLPYGEVIIIDKAKPDSKKTGLKNIDILFILVPISDFEKCCVEIKHWVNPSTLIVDCCSVKVYPVKIMRKIFLPVQPILATHPLFGPDSVKKTGGLSEHKIVICSLNTNSPKQKRLISVFEKMGLHIINTTPEDHDKQMASSQALVHFIGRGLAGLELKAQELSTPDFQALLNINMMVMNDTQQLFLDMNRYNPFTKEMREKLIQQLISINQEIES